MRVTTRMKTPKPIPPRAPEPTVLPPTDRDRWADPPELETVRTHFNAGDYRACVEPIEALFFQRRNTFHQALLMYTVALLQLRLGLVLTPRSLLTQALELWSAYPEWQEGIALAELRAHAEALLERLPEGVHSLPPKEVESLCPAPPRL
jgi:hypothetical protein